MFPAHPITLCCLLLCWVVLCCVALRCVALRCVVYCLLFIIYCFLFFVFCFVMYYVVLFYSGYDFPGPCYPECLRRVLIFQLWQFTKTPLRTWVESKLKIIIPIIFVSSVVDVGTIVFFSILDSNFTHNITSWYSKSKYNSMFCHINTNFSPLHDVGII